MGYESAFSDILCLREISVLAFLLTHLDQRPQTDASHSCFALRFEHHMSSTVVVLHSITAA